MDGDNKENDQKELETKKIAILQPKCDFISTPEEEAIKKREEVVEMLNKNGFSVMARTLVEEDPETANSKLRAIGNFISGVCSCDAVFVCSGWEDDPDAAYIYQLIEHTGIKIYHEEKKEELNNE